MHLAPLDVGALVLPPRGFQPRGLDDLVGSTSLARQFGDPVQKLLPKAAQVLVQRGGALSQEYVDPKCRPRFGELLRALFEHGAIKFRKRPSPLWNPCYLEKNRDQRGALVTLKRLTRNHHNMHKSHLVIRDAVAVILALKRRSSSRMAPLCRAASVYVLASFCRVAHRRALSGWNGADLPSRDRLHQ